MTFLIFFHKKKYIKRNSCILAISPKILAPSKSVKPKMKDSLLQNLLQMQIFQYIQGSFRSHGLDIYCFYHTILCGLCVKCQCKVYFHIRLESYQEKNPSQNKWKSVTCLDQCLFCEINVSTGSNFGAIPFFSNLQT